MGSASSAASFLTLGCFLLVKIAAAKTPVALKKLQCSCFQRNFLLFLCRALKLGSGSENNTGVAIELSQLLFHQRKQILGGGGMKTHDSFLNRALYSV